MADMRTYKVYYTANDGTECTFKFQSDRSFKLYYKTNADGMTMAKPIFDDMMHKAQEIMSRPESAMKKHGGCMYNKIHMVRCLETGEMRMFQ